MASWLVRLTPEQAVWVQALAEDIVYVFLGNLYKTLHSHSAYFHPGV